MADWRDVAESLFSDVDKSIDDYRKMYPVREGGKIVSRFGPSPTGFLHLGGIFSAFVSWKYAKQNDGIFFLRIEDTDQKRQVEGAVDLFIDGFKTFDMNIDEGSIGEGNNDVGNYGPYMQSKRKDIYRTFVKRLVAQGKAYPCWMSSEEMDSIRDQQTKSKIAPGIYGNYSVWRNKEPDELLEKISKEAPLVIRLRAHGNVHKKMVFEDVLRGKINMTDNYNDIVLIKSDGLPTYHLAHLVDDYLMGTTHVIRSEEWLASVPLHLQLFEYFGFQAPNYCHLAPILKLDNGKKRKLSKRKDPESDVAYFFEKGFDAHGIINYLMTIVDHRFEQWQKENTTKTYRDFSIVLDSMNKAGALLDMEKMKFMNNLYLSSLSNKELFDKAKIRAEKHHPGLYRFMHSSPDYALAALSIERGTEKDPKRYNIYPDIVENILFFSDEEWDMMKIKIDKLKEENLKFDLSFVGKFVKEYGDILDLDMDIEAWFDQLKEIGKKYGFAGNNQEFKEGGYIGKIGDLAMFLRIQLCGATRTPDLFSVMKVMGKDRVVARLR